MATPTKETLREQLRALNVVPPGDATSDELQRLLRRVKALQQGEAPTPPRARSTPPPAARPTFDPQPQPPSPGETLARARISDHERRPYDPMAGW